MKFDTDDIKAVLKQREPFLFIDSVADISDDSIEALLNVEESDIFFKGHFPGNPIIPGVLLIESMAQTAGFLIAYNLVKEKGMDVENLEYDFYLSKVNSMKFKSKIMPPATLRIKAKINPSLIENFCEASGQIYVGEELKAVGNLLLYMGIKK